MRLVRDSSGTGRRDRRGAPREAVASFGDGTLLVERFITSPRHIEIQVFADAHGNAVHLGERECSLQRRHQKIIEEAPSPLLADGGERGVPDPGRDGRQRGRRGPAVDYTGAGTVEYIVSADRPDEYFFMEMNTRLQVEHPVTEMAVTVELIRDRRPAGPGRAPAAGGRRRAAAGAARTTCGSHGHAAEARVYAEDPARGFLPTGGRVLRLAEPRAAVGAGRLRADRGQRGRRRVRPDAGQGDRARTGPAGGTAPSGPGAGQLHAARGADQRGLPARAAGRS